MTPRNCSGSRENPTMHAGADPSQDRADYLCNDIRLRGVRANDIRPDLLMPRLANKGAPDEIALKCPAYEVRGRPSAPSSGSRG